MSRLRPRRQQGFGLLVFVLMASIIALSIVLGYSGLLTREEANRRPAKLRMELEHHRDQMLGFYQQHAATLDSPSLGAGYTIDDLLAAASIPRRRGLNAAISGFLPADGGVFYRRIVFWYPSETDETNPPDLASFAATGAFTSCGNPDEVCAPRIFVELSSLEIEKANMVETQRRLERVALKAQAYFKARMLQDPEKNISMNYFRPAYGDCSRLLQSDLECLNGFTPLAVATGTGWTPNTNLGAQLGLSGDELLSAWGEPLQASNAVADSETVEPPYTLVFRAPSPFGGFVTVRAVQQI